MSDEFAKLDWQKMNGMIPAIIQDAQSFAILMLGYMNQEALQKTLQTRKVTFYSRRRNALWVKGETSGNELTLIDIRIDCDNDTLLVLVKPNGPTCHQGTYSCFKTNIPQDGIISRLEKKIAERQQHSPEGSYVAALFASGIGRMAQKVGEEGVEVALAAALSNQQTLTEEVADLLFHVLVLLRAREVTFSEVLDVLEQREQ